VRRLADADLSSQLANASAEEMPELFAAAGLWYDAVQALLMLRLEDPDEIAWVEDWQTLVSHPMVQLTHLMDIMPMDACLAVSCSQTFIDAPSKTSLVPSQSLSDLSIGPK
ncbi:MAG: DUF928 domain-containing protein, partial [Moorea sp. SIO3C2]|nr:DUF928 domain-containing protein [Moorena sp. SIO3C2]